MPLTPLEPGMRVFRAKRPRRKIVVPPLRDHCIYEIHKRLHYGWVWLSQQSDGEIHRIWRTLHRRKPRPRRRYTKLRSVTDLG